MIIGPWGDVKVRMPVFEDDGGSVEQGIAVTDVDLGEVEGVRERMRLLPRR